MSKRKIYLSWRVRFPFADYLKQIGERRALIVTEILDEQDWIPFERCYSSTGRAPYSPRSMMGILLYGIMKGHSALRALENLARLDLGCIFVSHGVTANHASLERFIYQHQTVLTGNFFKELIHYPFFFVPNLGFPVWLVMEQLLRQPVLIMIF